MIIFMSLAFILLALSQVQDLESKRKSSIRINFSPLKVTPFMNDAQHAAKILEKNLIIVCGYKCSRFCLPLLAFNIKRPLVISCKANVFRRRLKFKSKLKEKVTKKMSLKVLTFCALLALSEAVRIRVEVSE